MAGESGKQLPESISFGVFDLVPKIRGAELVRLVTNDQVPVGFLQLDLNVFVPAEFIESANCQWMFLKPVSGGRCFERIVSHDVERQVEAAAEFVLPLLDEVPRTDDQAPVKIAAGDKFLYEKASHDGLTGTRIVREEEPQGLAGKHFGVHRCNLVGKWLNERRMHGQQRIEEICELDAASFGDEAEMVPVAIKAPGPSGILINGEGRFPIPIQKFVAQSSRWIFVR